MLVIGIYVMYWLASLFSAPSEERLFYGGDNSCGRYGERVQ